MDNNRRREGGRRGYGGNNNNNFNNNYFCKGEFQNNSTRSTYRKPHQGSWQSIVPSWEKEFCYVIGGVPWRKLLDTKKYIHMYDNVLQWNDSSGEEAFDNAKSRFYAKKKRVPCDISLPDPDAYIDEVDWDSEINPELLLDLERELDAPAVTEDDEKVQVVDSFLDQTVPCTGWGDDVEGQVQNSYILPPTGWGTDDEDQTKDSNLAPATGWNVYQGDQSKDTYMASAMAQVVENPWEHGYVESKNGALDGKACGDSWDVCGWNQWGNKVDDTANWSNKGHDSNWETWDGNNRWSGESPHYNMSRFKTSRFHGDEFQRDRGWRNGRGKRRVSFDYVTRPPTDEKQTTQKWTAIKSCQPLDHGSRNAADHWSWEKPVS